MRVGIASPRVVVRQVEMPVMTRDELASALQFQAGELIPIPIDDAVLDFAILGTPRRRPSRGRRADDAGAACVAAHEATVAQARRPRSRPAACEVGAVDLVPLALTRALARPGRARSAPAARRVGVAVDDSARRRRHRVVRWRRHRDRGARGRRPAVRARARQRWPRAHRRDRDRPRRPAGDRGGVEARARRPRRPTRWSPGRAPSIDRPLSVLLDEVRSSIDYYRNQPGSAPLRRVVVTGGSAQLPGLPERLSALVGVPVEPAYMHDLVAHRRHRLRRRRAAAPRAVPPGRRSVSRSAARTSAPSSTCCRAHARSVDEVARPASTEARHRRGRGRGGRARRRSRIMAHSDQSSAQVEERRPRRPPEQKLRSQLYCAAAGPGRRHGHADRGDAQGGRRDRARPGRRVADDRSTDIGVKLPAGRVRSRRSRARTRSAGRRDRGARRRPRRRRRRDGRSRGDGDRDDRRPRRPPTPTTCAPRSIAPAGTVAMNGIAPDLAVGIRRCWTRCRRSTPTSRALWVSTAQARHGRRGRRSRSTASLGIDARGHRLESFFKGAKCK